MANSLTRTVAGRGRGRPTRETTILQDKKKCKRKKKMSNAADTNELTILAQGDAREKDVRENWLQ
jgi:hypothetical protein